MSKEAYYFSHDANARHDPKIAAMREDYGLQGYGAYWIIIEMLREQEDYKMPLKKYIWSAIAMQMQCKDYTKEHAHNFVSDCISEYELFDTDGEFFWSKSLIKRMEKKNDVSEKRRAAAQKRWAKNSNDDDADTKAMQKNANALQNDAKERKGKESKGNKNNNNNNTAPNDTAKIMQFWDNNGFGFNNTNAKMQLLDWLDDKQFIEAGPIILKAMEIASAANKRSLKYVEGILRNWFNQGCATLADVDAYQEQFDQKGKNKKGGTDWEALASG